MEARGEEDAVVIVGEAQVDAPVAASTERGLVHGERERLDTGPGRLIDHSVHDDRPRETRQVQHAPWLRRLDPGLKPNDGRQRLCAEKSPSDEGGRRQNGYRDTGSREEIS